MLWSLAEPEVPPSTLDTGTSGVGGLLGQGGISNRSGGWQLIMCCLLQVFLQVSQAL